MDKSYSKLVDIAYNMHVSGKLDEALDVYNKLLSINPDDLNVQNLYAQLNVSLKNYDLALEIFKKIYNKTKLEEIKINIAQIYMYKKKHKSAIDILKNSGLKDQNTKNILALSYMGEKDYETAIYYFKELTKIISDNSQLYYNISLCYKYLNNIQDSLKYALKAFETNHNDKDILLHIAYLYEELKDYSNAIIFLEKVAANNQDESILYQLGILYKKSGDYKKAVESFDKVIHINPNNKNAMLNIALTYKSIDMKNAIEIYYDIQKIFPNDLSIPFYIYLIYYEMFDYKNALNIALELINRNSNEYLYYIMAGDCYLELMEYTRAIDSYKEALKISPDNKSVKESLANAYCSNGDLDISEEILKSINCFNDTYTVIKLKQKELKSIIDEYFKFYNRIHDINYIEHKARKFFNKLNILEKFSISEEEFLSFGKDSDNNLNILQIFSKKSININDKTENKNILIYCSHGIGDFLMFCRYINIIKEKSNTVLLYIPKNLKRLVKYNFPKLKIYIKGENIDENLYDYSMSEMHAICCSGTDLNNIPSSKGYLTVSPKSVKEKAKLKVFNTNKKKIGLFWQGNPTVFFNRSVKLKELLPLFDISDIQIFSFQISKIDDESEKLKNTLPLIDLSEYIKDYNDTAALLKNIDILITIDTSIAHLAGAMGIKTFLLLPYDSEWRWFTDEEKTPWYDSIKIFKQKNPNQWNEVIKRVKDEIQLSRKD